MSIDLRSDTVTQPSPKMRQAIAEANVGDDVFEEDPTADQLQQKVAQLLNKETALFVPSGVMSNQIALKVHTQSGDEVLLDEISHIYNYESGAPAVLSGVQLHPVRTNNGLLDPDRVAAGLRTGQDWEPRSRLLCVENTVNKAGGRIYPLDRIHALADLAASNGLALHLDGARLWNASAATGIAEATYAEPFDTVSVCLSKGLGAPVGSVLAGPAEVISRARRYRKMFGGGMRQIGILAAAGLYALKHHRPHLARDHEKARRLAEAVASCPPFTIDLDRVQTNIVLFETADTPAAEVLERLADHDVQMVPFGPYTIRATTHRDVSMQEIEQVVDVLHQLYGQPATT